jgi:predicted ATPase
MPLILVIEDSGYIDEISIEFLKNLVLSDIKGMCIITTYQDKISNIIKNPYDNFGKCEMIKHENTFIMENIVDNKEVNDLLLYNIDEKLSINSIRPEVIDIVLTKSFKGNPLLTIDVLHSLLESQTYVKHSAGEITATQELNSMYEHNDWSNFKVPLRFEKLVGNIIDSLSPKEIILLKHAAIIGNIFDIDKLYSLNPFDSITFDDLVSILTEMETNEVIEILYDLNPKQTVYKFSIPFLREILYQRMLIEQRNDIHLNVARKLQYAKFSYMPHYKEQFQLQTHLRIAEKSIINYMEEDDDIQTDNSLINNKQKTLSLNSLKILIVKDICEKLKVIDLRLDSQEIDISKRSMPIMKSGTLNKKSDKNITWEK